MYMFRSVLPIGIYIVVEEYTCSERVSSLLPPVVSLSCFGTFKRGNNAQVAFVFTSIYKFFIRDVDDGGKMLNENA